MGEWKPAKTKLTKSQKRRGAVLREEIAWLENKLETHPEHVADDVRLEFEHPPTMERNSYGKITVVRIEGGRTPELREKLSNMKSELRELYGRI